MYPDAHLYIHRSEQAARERAYLRDGHRRPRTSHSRSLRLRDLFSRRTVKTRRLREGAAFSHR
jgi:hypothetical protein